MRSTSAWISWLSGLVLLAGGCGGSSGGGGSFYVETCSLGCSNGLGGNQVSCGVVNAAENQDLAMLFSGPVSLASVSKQSFQIFNVNTGAVPAGSFLIDPLNKNRLIFRPKLSFDINGNPIFGFQKNASYKLLMSGQAQGDGPPYVTNTSGRSNESRVLCTITTSGIVDPIPGKPTGRVFVERLDPVTQQQMTVELQQGQIPGTTEVLTDSNITFVFDELMNVGTLVVPSTGQSPFIQVVLDIDGDLNTVNDRATVEGTYSFAVDVTAQTTTVLFDPTKGYPSAGSSPTKPRLVVIDLPAAISDIAGNGLGNAGIFNFAPQVVLYPERSLTEDFTTETSKDSKRTGADWGVDAVGQKGLAPGEGGGSGRHGDLRVKDGEVVVLHSSPARATGSAQYLMLPTAGDVFEVAGGLFTFSATGTGATQVKIQMSLHWTIATLVDKLNAYAVANPGSGVAKASYVQSGSNSVLITAKDPGTAGNSLTLSASPPGTAILSGATLKGGSAGATFSSPNTLTNYDFGAAPGTSPPDVVVSNGVLEFSSVVLEPDATLVLEGDNPARILVRGELDLGADAAIDAAGQDRNQHGSVTPYGQPGGLAGPSAGAGGRGGDRSNTPDQELQAAGAVTLANGVLDGSGGVGVNGAAGAGEQGLGGVHWPSLFPISVANPQGLAVFQDPFLVCPSHQVGGAGSGGAYATDGIRGIARTTSGQTTGVTSTGATVCTLPPNASAPCQTNFQTLGGASASIGLEPPSLTPFAERLLTPAQGYLRGGAGGGGGGTHLFGTTVVGFATCFGFALDPYLDNSAAGGGGGGGALQVQVGSSATIAGTLDTSGGTGGSASTDPTLGTQASPGGGGSGGALLLQAGALNFDPLAGRLDISGGAGGVGITNSLGGGGGTGLVRVEQRTVAPNQQAIAQLVVPTDPGDPDSIRWLSVGQWSYDPDPAVTTTEEGFTGAQSCWLRVPDQAFSLTFLDDPAGAAPDDMGWNMDVLIDLGGGPQWVPFRGDDGLGPVAFGGLYPEEFWGQLLNSELQPGEQPAPIVVRFQGSKTNGPIANLCDVDPDDPLGGLLPSSTTPWVPATTDLNFFIPLSDIVRWTVVFDRSHPDASKILAVSNIRIDVQPE